MRLLSVGPFSRISNTCRFRNEALRGCVEKLDEIDTSCNTSFLYRVCYHLFLLGIPVRLPDQIDLNRKVLYLIDKYKYDIVWIDKGLTISPKTLRMIKEKQPNTILINFSPDNMMERPWQSQQYLECISLYDYHITTKSFLIDLFYKKKAQRVLLVNKTFQKDFHYPRQLELSDIKELGADIGFVGSWEKERCESILYLVDNGLKVKVFGDKEWKKYSNYCDNLTIMPYGLYGENYAKSFTAFKISLCFLKKSANDQQTARSVEIPACGGFMLAERTEEHKKLFEEDKEAVYFSSNSELLEKCKYYLSHDNERIKIAANGRQRCIDSDYSNEGMIRRVLTSVMFEL